MTKVLITGANGFLAKKLAESLSGDYRIVGLFNKSENKNFVGEAYFSFQELSEKESSFDIIFHLASYIPYGEMNEFDSELIESNIKLTLDLCNMYAKSRFVFTSSVSIYRKGALEIDTSSSLDNPSAYGMSKIAGECIVRSLKSFAIARMTSIVGKGMHNKTFIPLIIKSAKEKGIIYLWGDGSRKQDYISVEAAVNLLLNLALDGKNMIVNGVSGFSYSNLEIAEMIQKELGCKIELKGVDNSPSFSYASDPRIQVNNDLNKTIREML